MSDDPLADSRKQLLKTMRQNVADAVVLVRQIVRGAIPRGPGRKRFKGHSADHVTSRFVGKDKLQAEVKVRVPWAWHEEGWLHQGRPRKNAQPAKIGWVAPRPLVSHAVAANESKIVEMLTRDLV